MSRVRIFALTSLAMTAFAANSLLCRMALNRTGIDAGSFTAIRIVSGAVMLWLILRTRQPSRRASGSWPSALALFVYAAAFSLSYASLSAATGALLLFGAVQVTMIGRGLWMGERLRGWQPVGLTLAFGGLVGLLLPGLSAPPLSGSMLMLAAGVAWGVYSLRGKGEGDPLAATAGNFQRAVVLAVVLSVAMLSRASLDLTGVACAIASGALASGLGYTVWYTAMRELPATSAATVQLSVPVIAAFGGIVFLGEAVTLRLLLASAAILGGAALVIADKGRARKGASG